MLRSHCQECPIFGSYCAPSSLPIDSDSDRKYSFVSRFFFFFGGKYSQCIDHWGCGSSPRRPPARRPAGRPHCSVGGALHDKYHRTLLSSLIFNDFSSLWYLMMYCILLIECYVANVSWNHDSWQVDDPDWIRNFWNAIWQITHCIRAWGWHILAGSHLLSRHIERLNQLIPEKNTASEAPDLQNEGFARVISTPHPILGIPARDRLYQRELQSLISASWLILVS